MRIISGNFKGKKLFLPKDKKTRPLKDIVKESIFNLIHHSKKININIEKSLVLDLFSGTGSFGIECISRGAKKVIFFEDYKPAIELLIKNINILSFNKQTEIINKNIYNQNNFKKLNFKFDIVFLDPPFKDNNIKLILDNLANAEILKPKTLIIIHRHKKTKDNLDIKFKTIREEIYGSSKVIFGFFIF